MTYSVYRTISCDYSRCDSAESTESYDYPASVLRTNCRALGWRLNVRVPGAEPLDFCPNHSLQEVKAFKKAVEAYVRE